MNSIFPESVSEKDIPEAKHGLHFLIVPAVAGISCAPFGFGADPAFLIEV